MEDTFPFSTDLQCDRRTKYHREGIALSFWTPVFCAASLQTKPPGPGNSTLRLASLKTPRYRGQMSDVEAPPNERPYN